MVTLVIGVLGLLTIALSAAVAPKLRIASPLLLTVLGVAVSLLPVVPDVEIDPEWIIAGVLPPLLYASSVAMPAMDFRRDFTAISGLSVLLVVITAVVVGWIVTLVVPGLGFALGVALGAIVSPTDAVATRIVRGLGVSPRIVAILEGESLLNDASALVLLRSAVAATAVSVHVGTVAGSFAYSVAVAVAIGLAAGIVALRVRRRIEDPTVNTVVSFTIPFLASVPAELLGASGLVAAVVAGLVIGQGAAKYLKPAHRLSDRQNWRTVELVLEGTIFLTMGLELSAILTDIQEADGSAGVRTGVLLALLVLVLVVAVRAAYVAWLLVLVRHRTRRAEQMRGQIDLMRQAPDWDHLSPRRRLRWRTRIRRAVADIDYLLGERLGWREGVVIVWAGMRGAVTLAAAQTLPRDSDHRSMLVFVAFMVAVMSLFGQGATLRGVVRLVRPATVDPQAQAEEIRELAQVMRGAAEKALARHGDDPAVAQVVAMLPGTAEGEDTPSAPDSQLRLEALAAERAALLALRSEGGFSSAALSAALDGLDAAQLSLEMRALLNAEDAAG